jgi:3-keto-disaccharide hydrolase
MTNKSTFLATAVALFVSAAVAMPAGLTDGVELSGKWQPVMWGTPEKPKPARLKNVSPPQLAELPSDIVLDSGKSAIFSFWEWGDCRLTFELKGNAAVKLLGEIDVANPSGSDWVSHDVQFRAPRWNGATQVSPALLVVNGKSVKLPAISAPAAEQINARGEQFGPLHIELAGGSEARIRDLWVGPLTPSRDTSGIPWRDMFDADSLKGWELNGGDAPYRRESGEVVGTTKPGTPNSFLISERDYGNFEFSVEVYGDVAFNAGLQFRSLGKGGRGRRNRTHGYQCEIDPSERAWTAGIYDEARRGWLHPLNYTPPQRNLIEKGKWHEFRIYADGAVIKTFLDGKLISQIYDAMTLEGYFGLQVHGTKEPEPHEIRWRNVRIRELD